SQRPGGADFSARNFVSPCVDTRGIAIVVMRDVCAGEPDVRGEPLPVARPSHRFQPGGPGRPKGARNKLGERFIADFYDHWNKVGVEAIDKLYQRDLTTYMKVIAKIIPSQLHIDNESPLAGVDDGTLAAIIDIARLIRSDPGSLAKLVAASG